MLKETKDLFDDHILEQALNLFNGSKEKCKDLGGFEAFVYELDIENKYYIMKITHTIRRTVDYIMGELEFVNYLAQNNVPTSKAVPSIHNNFVETIDTTDNGQFLVYLFEKAEGRRSNYKDWNDDIIFTWGQVSGMMNRLTKEYTPSKTSYTRQQWHKDDIYKFEKYIPASQQTTIDNCRKIIEQTKTYPRDINTYGLIHGDLHHGNFFINNGNIIPFDFDDCEYSFLINDIAIPLFYTLPKDDSEYGVTKKEFGENFFYNFLKGYRTENQIDKEWILKIPQFLLVRSVIMYSLFNQIWMGETLDEKQEATLERHRCRIDDNVPVVDIDFSTFV